MAWEAPWDFGWVMWEEYLFNLGIEVLGYTGGQVSRKGARLAKKKILVAMKGCGYGFFG
jgi:hypothetical protein